MAPKLYRHFRKIECVFRGKKARGARGFLVIFRKTWWGSGEIGRLTSVSSIQTFLLLYASLIDVTFVTTATSCGLNIINQLILS